MRVVYLCIVIVDVPTGRLKQEAVALGMAVPVTIVRITRRPIIRIAGSIDRIQIFECRIYMHLTSLLYRKK